MTRKYTGIGSRSTPPAICTVFTGLAGTLEEWGFDLRSGGADRADKAFEDGVTDPARAEIYLPWRGFNGSRSPLFNTPAWAEAEASLLHPAWGLLNPAARKLHARNVCQVLGYGRTPSEFLVCWTEGGRDVGGTATALRLAQALNIPVFNFGAGETAQNLTRVLAHAMTIREGGPA